MVFLVLNSGTIGYLFYYTFVNSDNLKASIITMSLVIGSFIFLGLTLLLTLFYFISDYFIDKTWRLVSFEAKKKLQKKPIFSTRYQVAPVSVE